jgi:site-specific DNA recombinase
MKIAIYARVSSEKQAKEGTIESQIEVLKCYAKDHNLNIAFDCIDDGYSGTTLIRPGLDQLRDLAQAGSIEGILILSPDRLSRTQANQIILTQEFKKRNVQLIFTNQNSGDTPEDNLMLQIQGAIAEYDRIKILDRMRRGAIHAAKKGQVNGSNPPLGYRYIPKCKNEVGHWEVNSDEAKNVKYIFDLYVNEKLKGTQIAKRLNDESVPCRGNKWWSSQIYTVLKNETYTGIAYMFKERSVEPKKYPKAATYRKTINTAKAPRPRNEWLGIPVTPIIDLQTWTKAQALLKQNAKQSRRNNNKHEYLLRGLVVCGVCGCIASGYVSNKSTYYSCGAKRHKNITSKPHDELIQVKQKLFDEKVWGGLAELLSDPENLKAQIEKRIQTKSAKLPIHHSIYEFDQDLDQLAKQEKRILDAYREEVISLPDLKEQKDMILNRRRVLEAKKNAVLSQSESLGQPRFTMDKLGDVSTRFQRVMAKSDFATREKLVNLLVNSVALMTDKAIVAGNIPVTNLDALNTPRFRRGFILG